MRCARFMVVVAAVAAGSLTTVQGAAAAPAPATLGNGLARLLEPDPERHGARLTMDPLAIRDAAGRVLVTVQARDAAALADVRSRAEEAGLQVVAAADELGRLEGFIALEDVAELASAPGVATVAQTLQPQTRVGAATSQGVGAHRADRLPAGIDGSGITVGVLSDSFDTATRTTSGAPLTIHAADDIRTGDLPADGVTVLEDRVSPQSSDEGRAMAQIVHDVAPGARLCFATAFLGTLSFAENIRALADPDGPCAADVIVDDVGYLDEPFFGLGPIGDAIDDVAAQGVHYYSAAGNDGNHRAFHSPLRIVPVDGATAGTNLDLTGVDPGLYSGGFLDFDAGAGQDVAQDIGIDGSGTFDLQWDDPIDPDGPLEGDPLLTTTGEITATAPVATIPFAGTEGQTIRAVVDALPTGSTDLVLTLKAPDGAVLQRVDTSTSPEAVVATLATTGTYTFEVSGFLGDVGDFTLEVRLLLASSRTTTDLNALFFDAAGRFVAAADDDNRLSGKPFEITGLNGRSRLQLVVAKAGAEPGEATQVRYVMTGRLVVLEYDQPLAPAIYGHPLARGATAVAAYDPFRPFLPEDFTSPGGDLPILFDSGGVRLPEPDVRRAPQIAATDGGNTTFFTTDTAQDDDALPNFFGTSAAAPHAAGIAALVLQARGPLDPDALRALLQESAFRHDRDPFHADGRRFGLTISADGHPGAERGGLAAGGLDDPRFFTVAWRGRGSLETLVLDGAGANATGRVRDALYAQGLVFDPRPFAGLPLLGGPALFAQGFSFVIGAASPGIDPAAVTAVPGRPAVGDAGPDQFQTLTITFPPGALTAGGSVSFGIDRDETVTAFGSAQGGNSADHVGQAVRFPSGRPAGPGMTFTATTSLGRVLLGSIRNDVGVGWTALDGYGFVNAEAAVEG